MDTNEGFGYISLFSMRDMDRIKQMDLVVKKQRIRFKEPRPIKEMREYLSNLRLRQVHVSGLGRKANKGKAVD